jgi:molybdate/tungstate transport system substrate-binding protein
VLALAALASGCTPRNEVVVFHAASLSRVFGALAEQLKARTPPISVRLEPSGSTVAARKVSEQQLRADVVAVADDAVLRRLLVPAHAAAVTVFATNELVLAHLEHSRGTAEVTAENWTEVLARPGVRLGRVNEDLAPLGYHTLLAWQLAELELKTPGLAAALRGAVAKEHVAADETELLGLLEARALDYAFLYRSTAEDHRLKVTRLPPAFNLASAALGHTYARATVPVRLSAQGAPALVPGRPITYGLSIPNNAPNPAGARAFVELLESETGQAALRRHGFLPAGVAR